MEHEEKIISANHNCEWRTCNVPLDAEIHVMVYIRKERCKNDLIIHGNPVDFLIYQPYRIYTIWCSADIEAFVQYLKCQEL